MVNDGKLPAELSEFARAVITASRSKRTMQVAQTRADVAAAYLLDARRVETHDQHLEVAALGCEAAQGYFSARPIPASAIDAHQA